MTTQPKQIQPSAEPERLHPLRTGNLYKLRFRVLGMADGTTMAVTLLMATRLFKDCRLRVVKEPNYVEAFMRANSAEHALMTLVDLFDDRLPGSFFGSGIAPELVAEDEPEKASTK